MKKMFLLITCFDVAGQAYIGTIQMTTSLHGGVVREPEYDMNAIGEYIPPRIESLKGVMLDTECGFET